MKSRHEIGWNAFVDTALVLIPITIIGDLKLDVGKRIGLCILLGLGILCVTSNPDTIFDRGADNYVKRCY